MKFSDFKKDLDKKEQESYAGSDSPSKVKNLELILDIVRSVNQTLIEEDVLKLVLENAIKLTNSERGFIVLKDKRGGLEFKLGLDSLGNNLPESSFSISTTVVKDVFETGVSKFIEGAQSDTDFDPSKSILRLNLQTILCTPLITDGKKIGVIYVDSKKLQKIKAADITSTFEILAGQAATAILNAQLYNGQIKAYNALNEANIQLIQAERKVLKSSIDAEIGKSLQGLVHMALLETESLVRLIEKTENESKIKADNPDSILFDRLKLKAKIAIDSIRNIQKYAQILKETSAMELNISEGDLNHTIQKVIKYISPMKQFMKVVFNTEFQSLPVCKYDSEQIQHLLVQLLNNSAKAKEDATITIRTFSDKKNIYVEVEDNGPGFPRDMKNPFYDVLTSNKSSYGLFLCRSIIERHNGKIKILPKSNGASIQFSLPVASL